VNSLWKGKTRPGLADTHVLQSHGRIDPTCRSPAAGTRRCCDLLIRPATSGSQFMAFQGPHTMVKPNTLFGCRNGCEVIARLSTRQ